MLDFDAKKSGALLAKPSDAKMIKEFNATVRKAEKGDPAALADVK